jgi:Protein of unknown function (DUF4235)
VAGSRGNGVVFALAAVVAAATAKKVTEVIWTASTGHAAPGQVDDPDEDLREAVAFAVLSGAAAGLIRMLINRNTRRFLKV